MEAIEYRHIFAHEESHWWYRGLRNLVRQFITIWAREHGSFALLDAGCGAGMMLKEIQHLPQCRHAVGIDISPYSLDCCKERNLDSLARGSVDILPFRNSSFDVVISLDVIYHRQVMDDVVALQEFHRVLRPDGLLVLNLPAFESLRSPHDLVVHTKIRYTRVELAAKLQRANFRPEKLSYRNCFLFPIIWLIRQWKNLSANRHKMIVPARSDVSRISAPLNQMLYLILGVENALLPYGSFPCGTSLFCVARKT